MHLALTIPKDRSWLAYGSGLAFICYAAASVLWVPKHTLESSVFLVTLVLAFWLGYFLRSMCWLWVGFCSFLCINLAFHLWEDAWGVYGNPNYFGCALAIGLASALAYRLWPFLPVLAGGLWLTQSRGAILGASAALFIWAWPKYKATAICLVGLGVVAILNSSHGQADGMWQRLGIWQDTLNHLTIWGAGWGSFYEAYWTFPIKTNMGFARAGHAYNDLLELTFELGLGVVLLWAFVIKIMSESTHETKLIIWTYLACALTFFPLYVWPIGPLVAATLGHLVKEQSDGE